MDSNDYLTLHWLARSYAWAHNTNEAFAVAVKALRAFPFHLPTLQLIVLLLSAQKNNYDALAVIDEALDEYPEHLGFLQLKAALEEKTSGPDVRTELFIERYPLRDKIKSRYFQPLNVIICFRLRWGL